MPTKRVKTFVRIKVGTLKNLFDKYEKRRLDPNDSYRGKMPTDDTVIEFNDNSSCSCSSASIDPDGARHYRVSFLSQDEANGWYFDENDSGRYIDPRCRGERMDPDPEQVKELIKANPGRAFRINKYQHSGCVYYRQGSSVEASIPDKRWDVCSGVALFIVPDDAPDPKKYCDAVMKEFTDWCNGEIYGICRVNYIKVDDTWKQVGDDEACWGYIGREYAEQELTSGHKE